MYAYIGNVGVFDNFCIKIPLIHLSHDLTMSRQIMSHMSRTGISTRLGSLAKGYIKANV